LLFGTELDFGNLETLVCCTEISTASSGTGSHSGSSRQSRKFTRASVVDMSLVCLEVTAIHLLRHAWISFLLGLTVLDKVHRNQACDPTSATTLKVTALRIVVY